MKNLFIIGTPGHYFNLLECIEKFELKKENSDLLFLNSNSTCPDKLLDNFVDNYVNKNDWNRVIRISLWDIPSRKLFSFHNIRLIITFLIKITLFFCLEIIIQ